VRRVLVDSPLQLPVFAVMSLLIVVNKQGKVGDASIRNGFSEHGCGMNSAQHDPDGRVLQLL
jgi:hypothetical protein